MVQDVPRRDYEFGRQRCGEGEAGLYPLRNWDRDWGLAMVEACTPVIFSMKRIEWYWPSSNLSLWAVSVSLSLGRRDGRSTKDWT